MLLQCFAIEKNKIFFRNLSKSSPVGFVSRFSDIFGAKKGFERELFFPHHVIISYHRNSQKKTFFRNQSIHPAKKIAEKEVKPTTGENFGTKLLKTAHW